MTTHTLTARHLPRRTVLAGTTLGALVAIAGCGGANDSTKAGPAEGESPSESSTSTGSNNTQAPAGFDEAVPYLTFAADSSGPVMELFVDWRCPHCKIFSEVNGEYVKQLVDSKAVQLRVYPRPMLDARTGTTFSTDTANAVTATYIQDPSLFWEIDKALFELQPATPEDPTPGTQEIANAAKAAGANEESVQAILDGKYTAWLQTVEAVGQERQIGTPTVYLNGEKVEEDFEQPGALQAAVEAAIGG